MRLTYPCLVLALSFTACGPGKDTTDATTGDTTGDTTGPATSDPTASGSTSPTEGPTTGPPGTTDPSTTASTTTTTSDPTTATTTSETSETTAVTTTLTTSTTTGVPLEPQCEVDADCFLRADCCTCEGLPVGVDHETCDGECDQSRCDELGIDKAVCRLGVCETERLSCDQSKVLCDAPTPDCPPDHLPETTPQCWTGKCIPAGLCDVITDCATCPPHMMCVQNVGFTPQDVRCEPIPVACDGVPTCNCVAELVCAEPFSACFSDGPVVRCECLNC